MCLHSPRVPLCLLGTPSEGQILHVNLMELHSQECLRGCWTVCSKGPCAVYITRGQGELGGAGVSSTPLHRPSRTSLLPEQIWLKL